MFYDTGGLLMRLFVIGNGFDLAHDIESKYCHFGNYLLEHQPDYYNNLMCAFDSGDHIWGAFEDELPSCAINIENNGLDMVNQRLEELDYDPMSDEGVGYYLRSQYRFINELPNFLRKWVETIDINKQPCFKKSLFREDDLILTFNYTNTLEKLYGHKKDRICHIHGNVESQTDRLIIGHGNKKHIEYVKNDLVKAEAELADGKISVYKCELNYLKNTYKDTAVIINAHKEFFNRISKCDEVIIIGLSLSKADRPYIQKMIDLGLDRFILYYRCPKQKSDLENAIKEFSLSSDHFVFLPIEDILAVKMACAYK